MKSKIYFSSARVKALITNTVLSQSLSRFFKSSILAVL